MCPGEVREGSGLCASRALGPGVPQCPCRLLPESGCRRATWPRGEQKGLWLVIQKLAQFALPWLEQKPRLRPGVCFTVKSSEVKA